VALNPYADGLYAMVGHRLMGASLLFTGDVAASDQLDRALALYDPIEHRPLATRFGQDVRVDDEPRLRIRLYGHGLQRIPTISSGIAAWRSTGSTLLVPGYLKNLAKANAELGNLDEAWRGIDEAMAAMEATGERLWEAETNRIAGEIALLSPEPNAANAEAYFERAVAVARQQQAKSWELRAAMSMARLWRDQGKRNEARELLGPVYGWFTEGFDTRDLKEAKALLDEEEDACRRGHSKYL
jgi:hypothetical protein